MDTNPVIQTPMIAKMTNDPEGLRRLEHVQPFGRVGHPSEIAKTVVFLSSDDACGISAAGIPVDGGLLEQLKV
jgi:NAD(P)-dependent dehydrogenase (short-subunit alcohol dehydrogenase family)